MAWFEAIVGALPPFVNDTLIAFLIALLTIALVWGIRPAILYLLDRVVPRWSKWGTIFVQALLMLGGGALLYFSAGIAAFIVGIALASAFGAGLMIGGETPLGDRMATRRIHARGLYQVGDRVTLGNRIHGIVTAVGRTETRLESPDKATVTVRNSLVVRNPIVVHEPLVDHEPRPGTQDTSGGDSPVQAAMPATDGNNTTVPAEQPSTDPATDALSRADPYANHDAATTPPDTPSAERLGPQTSPWHKTIRTPAAAPLVKRRFLGKRTVHDLR